MADGIRTFSHPELVAQGIEEGSHQLAIMIRDTQTTTDDQRTLRNEYCDENGRVWDGGDGTYFDGQDNPDYDFPSISPVYPTVTIDQLAELGVWVNVSLGDGVRVTLNPLPTLTPELVLP
mmetsp:Transcript_56754/g.122658  ORF Transcript_56754/g.122658 Transcript_56754/m.122658 type:complete len:120 (+) Transcript_56754:140-499(+)